MAQLSQKQLRGLIRRGRSCGTVVPKTSPEEQILWHSCSKTTSACNPEEQILWHSCSKNNFGCNPEEQILWHSCSKNISGGADLVAQLFQKQLRRLIRWSRSCGTAVPKTTSGSNPEGQILWHSCSKNISGGADLVAQLFQKQLRGLIRRSRSCGTVVPKTTPEEQILWLSCPRNNSGV